MFCVGSLLSYQKSRQNRLNSVSVEEIKYEHHILCVTRTQRNGTNELWRCGIPSRITCEPNNRKNTFHPWYHTYTKKKDKSQGKEGRGKEKTTKEKCNNNKHALRAQAEYRRNKVRLPFADTISCPAGGPADGRHTKTRQEDTKRNKEFNTKRSVLCPGGGRRTTQKGQTKRQTERGQKERAKNTTSTYY